MDERKPYCRCADDYTLRGRVDPDCRCDDIEHYIDAAVAAETERCAKIADDVDGEAGNAIRAKAGPT